MKDYKNKNDKDLNKMLAEKRQVLRDFRFSIAGSKTRNVREGRKSRKDIAKILTELRARALKV
jgi:ribosomal protein L29